MQDRPPNQITRVIAVGGVITMFVLIIGVIALSSGSGSDDGGGTSDPGALTSTGPSNDPDIQKALRKGEYTVQDGDTMTAISEDTGIDIETLKELNPETDPQALIAGRKIKLR